MAWAMGNHVGAVSWAEAGAWRDVIANYDNQERRDAYWEEGSVALSHGIGDTVELLPRRHGTVSSEMKAEMKRKRSSIVEFGRKTVRRVSNLWNKKRRACGDSGYQSLEPPSTPEIEDARFDVDHEDGRRSEELGLGEERSIATAIDDDENDMNLLLRRHYRSSQPATPHSEARSQDVSGLTDDRSDPDGANPFDVEHVENAGYWDGDPPPYARHAVTPPDYALSYGDGAHMFDPDLFSMTLESMERTGELDEADLDDHYSACYGNQTCRGAQLAASLNYRESVISRIQRTSTPAEGQPGSSTWEDRHAESSDESLSSGFFSSV